MNEKYIDFESHAKLGGDFFSRTRFWPQAAMLGCEANSFDLCRDELVEFRRFLTIYLWAVVVELRIFEHKFLTFPYATSF